MKKRFFPRKDTKPTSKSNVKYRIKDRNRLYEIKTNKHGWAPCEFIAYTKNGRVVLRLLFSNQIIVRKISKKIRPYQNRRR